MTKDELIRQVRAAQARGQRARYAPPVRAAAIQYATELRATNVSWRDISKELGVGASLVQRWITGRPRLLPVKVIAPAPTTARSHVGVIVHGPRGVRVEGLSMGELAELLARLGT